VHDLRHTVGMRLREAGVPESTAADVLWHARRSMTAHYSLAQLVELHAALVKIEQPSEAWNKSLHTLRQEAQAARAQAASHPKVTQSTHRVA
jgi:integrase